MIPLLLNLFLVIATISHPAQPAPGDSNYPIADNFTVWFPENSKPEFTKDSENLDDGRIMESFDYVVSGKDTVMKVLVHKYTRGGDLVSLDTREPTFWRQVLQVEAAGCKTDGQPKYEKTSDFASMYWQCISNVDDNDDARFWFKVYALKGYAIFAVYSIQYNRESGCTVCATSEVPFRFVGSVMIKQQ